MMIRRRRPKGWQHPALGDVALTTMLTALAEPVRLDVIRQLACSGGVLKGAFDVEVTGSTLSHHLRVLTDAGLVRVTQEGRFRLCELRRAEVESRFPGLLPAVLAGAGVPGMVRSGPPSGVAGRW
ncbi:MAG TPA: helix-turn-helix domain-containing protein [Actinoplanes sp.]|nr:helix-turn-helix domain-containing protein [Actinoplanes sp.]